jgi:hypothetical protein
MYAVSAQVNEVSIEKLLSQLPLTFALDVLDINFAP